MDPQTCLGFKKSLLRRKPNSSPPRIWKNGGLDDTWTDGSAAVGNGMVFTVHNNKKEPLTQLMGQYLGDQMKPRIGVMHLIPL